MFLCNLQEDQAIWDDVNTPCHPNTLWTTMPAPAAFRDHLTARLTKLLPTVIDRVWDAAIASQKTLPANIAGAVSENSRHALLAETASKAVSKHVRGRPTKYKLGQGEARAAILKVIAKFPDHGISRAEIRTKVRPLLDGNEISPNTLKRALMDLRRAEAIFTRNSAWYPASADNHVYEK